MLARQVGRKRSRTADSERDAHDRLPEKKARPTTGDSDGWPNDSVMGTPTRMMHFLPPKYDSDSQSSMISEPGSPQDMSAESDSDMAIDTDDMVPSADPDSAPRPAFASMSSSWRHRAPQDRKPTPFGPARRPGIMPIQRIKTGPQTHVRDRHPQEITGFDHLEVPSPIDEDEVPTPPSAAEAAGSQLSMLSVSDVNMDEDETAPVPTISVDPTYSRQLNEHAIPDDDTEPMNSAPDTIVVRKQRQRSGALSSPRATPDPGPSKKTFLMGFRSDCEKCINRVPGHMNHIVS